MTEYIFSVGEDGPISFFGGTVLNSLFAGRTEPIFVFCMTGRDALFVDKRVKNRRGR